MVFLYAQGAGGAPVNAIDNISFDLLKAQVTSTPGATQLIDSGTDDGSRRDGKDFAAGVWALGALRLEEHKGKDEHADE